MSTSYSMKGAVHFVAETKQISDKFRKRDFVLDVQDGKYNQLVSFQAVNDRCDLLDDYQDGDEMSVEFNVRGREWTSPSGEVKYFNTLDAWKIERVGQRQERRSAPPKDEPSGGGYGGTKNPDDDIPF